MMLPVERVCVAIPVRNEQDHIGACLAALRRQIRPADDVLLMLNNCDDGTAALCQAAQDSLPLRIVEAHLPPALVSAGEARRLALLGALDLPRVGVILTTDADAVPADDWIGANLAALAGGAEAVCGTTHVHPVDVTKIPLRLFADHRIEVKCAAALDALDALIDADPADPWPRHQQHSGASIAVTATALRRAGGPPAVSHGEDRALIEKLRLADTKIRHAPEVSVSVSGRLDGRAAGGMADTIRRRLLSPDVFADEALEPAIDAYRRALAKARLRAVGRRLRDTRQLAEELLIPPDALAAALSAPYFGTAWAQVQNLSPVLHRRRLRVSDLPGETRHACLLREELLQWPLRQAAPENDQTIAS
jgi:glycosyltransferase involved in cell wall biosynthesis